MSGRAIHALTDARFVITLALAAVAGAAGLQVWPRPIAELIAVGRYEARRDRYDTDVLHYAQNRV